MAVGTLDTLAVPTSKLQPTHCLPTWHPQRTCLWIHYSWHFFFSHHSSKASSRFSMWPYIENHQEGPGHWSLDTGSAATLPEMWYFSTEQSYYYPNAMHPRVLQLAHEGHQGITKVKQHLRQRVWWPGLDIQAREFAVLRSLCREGESHQWIKLTWFSILSIWAIHTFLMPTSVALWIKSGFVRKVQKIGRFVIFQKHCKHFVVDK